MKKQITDFQKKTVLKLIALKHCPKSIANKLKKPLSTVHSWLKKLKTGLGLDRKIGSGKKQALSEDQKQKVKKLVLKAPFDAPLKTYNASDLALSNPISRQTICRALNEQDINCRIAAHKPRLTEQHRASRLNLTTKWVEYLPEFWENVIFSDESKFNIAGSDGSKKVWRENGTRYQKENLLMTEKFGGGKSIMVWGAITFKGPSKLIICRQSVTADYYQSIIGQILPELIEQYNLETPYFQQDGARAHTAYETINFIRSLNVNILEWAAQTSDLNPIENVWGQMKRILGNKRFKTLNELELAVVECWNSLSLDYFQTLIKSMPSRIQAVIDANGDSTKY